MLYRGKRAIRSGNPADRATPSDDRAGPAQDRPVVIDFIVDDTAPVWSMIAADAGNNHIMAAKGSGRCSTSATSMHSRYHTSDACTQWCDTRDACTHRTHSTPPIRT